MGPIFFEDRFWFEEKYGRVQMMNKRFLMFLEKELKILGRIWRFWEEFWGYIAEYCENGIFGSPKYFPSINLPASCLSMKSTTHVP